MKNKRNSVHYENLNQAIEKLETQLLFLKDVNIRDWNVLQFNEWYFESLQQRFCTQNKTKKIEKIIIFRYGNKINRQSRLNLKGWEWRWFLRKYIRKRTKKKQWRKRKSRSWRFSFHKYFKTFYYLFIFFSYFTLSLFFYTFFTHDIYPHPRPTTSIHYPRSTTFSYARSAFDTITKKHCTMF